MAPKVFPPVTYNPPVKVPIKFHLTKNAVKVYDYKSMVPPNPVKLPTNPIKAMPQKNMFVKNIPLNVNQNPVKTVITNNNIYAPNNNNYSTFNSSFNNNMYTPTKNPFQQQSYIKVDTTTNIKANTTINSDNKNKDFPPSLKDYASRAFEACTTEEEKNWMQNVLKNMISQSSESGTMWTIDWSKKKLPQFPKSNKKM